MPPFKTQISMKTFALSLYAFMLLVVSEASCSINTNGDLSLLGKREREEFYPQAHAATPSRPRREYPTAETNDDEVFMEISPSEEIEPLEGGVEYYDDFNPDIFFSPSRGFSFDANEIRPFAFVNFEEEDRNTDYQEGNITYTVPIGFLSGLDYEFMEGIIEGSSHEDDIENEMPLRPSSPTGPTDEIFFSVSSKQTLTVYILLAYRQIQR